MDVSSGRGEATCPSCARFLRVLAAWTVQAFDGSEYEKVVGECDFHGRVTVKSTTSGGWVKTK